MSTTLDIVPIPVLNDNYVWLMREPQSGSVGVVDPAIAGPVLAEAVERRWNREIKQATGFTKDPSLRSG